MKSLDALIKGPENADSAVIWLHGLGDSGHGFSDVVDMLQLPPHRRVRFILPHAPERPVTINGGMKMPAWYDVLAMDFAREIDEQAIRESADQVSALIQAQRDQGIPAARIVLAGFSQGGAVAFQTALVYPERLGGIIALSTYLAIPALLESIPRENADLPVFMGHGDADPVVPFALAEKSCAQLRAAGLHPQWEAYPGMPHSLIMEELRDISLWLTRILG